MTKDFENYLAANLAAPRVFELRRSADLFQTLERRFAAKFLQPGTALGVLLWNYFQILSQRQWVL